VVQVHRRWTLQDFTVWSPAASVVRVSCSSLLNQPPSSICLLALRSAVIVFVENLFARVDPVRNDPARDTVVRQFVTRAFRMSWASGLSMALSTSRRVIAAAFGSYIGLSLVWSVAIDVLVLVLFRFRPPRNPSRGDVRGLRRPVYVVQLPTGD